jgi:MFS family permease
MSAPLPLPAARRAALLLALASAIGGSAGPIAIGTGGLVGLALLPPEQAELATIPVAAYVIGSAAAAMPAALTMRRIGRRAGFMFGAGAGGLGAALTGFAIMAGSFWSFCVSLALLGVASAFIQQYRFAAADAAEPAYKPRAIAWVMAGGIVTGVVGPQVAIHARALLPDAPFAGPFFVLVVLFGLAMLALSRLEVPPPPPLAAGGRLTGAIMRQPRFVVALVAAVASYALMSLVMTATPIAMIEHHHSHADAQTGIQWHVIAMFAPSFVTGGLIARFGKSAIAVAGLLLIALSATVAISGTGLWQFWVALVLLGVGWNFGFIASTAMVADLYRPEEAFRVQAVNEFILFAFVAVASLASGGLLAVGGWTVVNLIVYPVVLVTIGLVVGLAIADRRAPQRAVP